MNRRYKRKKNRFKKILVVILSIILLFCIGFGAYIFSFLNKVQYNPLDIIDGGKKTSGRKELGISDDAPNEKETGVLNILLFGLDRRFENDASRSDSIMIATMNKKEKTLKITSLMRDMYVPIPDHDKNRINTAYIFGGPTLAIKTVNTNFNMDIEHYATVDFFALEAIIDKLDGIPIEVKAEELEQLNIIINFLNRLDDDSPKAKPIKEAGKHKLNGRQAVAYCSIRKAGNADFERTERQRTVLNEIFKKVKKAGIFKFPDILSSVLPHIETNLTKGEILSLGIQALGYDVSNVEEFRLPAKGTFEDKTIDGMRVLVPDIEKNKELLHEFIYGNQK